MILRGHKQATRGPLEDIIKGMSVTFPSKCNGWWRQFSQGRYFPWGTIVFSIVHARSNIWTLGWYLVYFILNNQIDRHIKYCSLVFSAVSELLLLGIALKKDAVCLASKDLHSFATKNPSVIIPKPARNKHQEDSKSSVYSTTFGDANFLGIVSGERNSGH